MSAKTQMAEEGTSGGGSTRRLIFARISDCLERWVLEKEDSNMRASDPSIDSDQRK